jgi:hypothetical protein
MQGQFIQLWPVLVITCGKTTTYVKHNYTKKIQKIQKKVSCISISSQKHYSQSYLLSKNKCHVNRQEIKTSLLNNNSKKVGRNTSSALTVSSQVSLRRCTRNVKIKMSAKTSTKLLELLPYKRSWGSSVSLTTDRTTGV